MNKGNHTLAQEVAEGLPNTSFVRGFVELFGDHKEKADFRKRVLNDLELAHAWHVSQQHCKGHIVYLRAIFGRQEVVCPSLYFL